MGSSTADFRCAIQGVRSLIKNEIDADFLLPLLKGWFDAYYADREVNVAGDLRMTICHVDKVLNGGESRS
ncbi:MAG TPA: hypothetical protein DCP41_03370 [Deltaproteobacteria bacterium]|nr:hypothetical protein [Deltaproteobacteria bacterium]